MSPLHLSLIILLLVLLFAGGARYWRGNPWVVGRQDPPVTMQPAPPGAVAPTPDPGLRGFLVLVLVIALVIILLGCFAF